MGNIFFFRDKEGYEPYGKIKRIKRPYVTPDEPIIKEYLEAAGYDKDDFDNPGKNEFISFLRKELDGNTFNELVDELFEEHGEEGDTFNIKTFQLSTDIDRGSLAKSAKEVRDNGLNKEDEASFSYVVQIDKVADRNEQGVVDIAFQLRGKRSNVSPEEIVWEEEGEERTLAEVIDQQPRMKTDYTVEVRVYPDAGMMAVTNSGIDKKLQGEIRSAIQRWG